MLDLYSARCIICFFHRFYILKHDLWRQYLVVGNSAIFSPHSSSDYLVPFEYSSIRLTNRWFGCWIFNNGFSLLGVYDKNYWSFFAASGNYCRLLFGNPLYDNILRKGNKKLQHELFASIKVVSVWKANKTKKRIFGEGLKVSMNL